jgi:hypothetical protein
MATVLFKCPFTSQFVSAWIADEAKTKEGQPGAVSCAACRAMHLVYPKTGKVVGKAINTSVALHSGQ